MHRALPLFFTAALLACAACAETPAAPPPPTYPAGTDPNAMAATPPAPMNDSAHMASTDSAMHSSTMAGDGAGGMNDSTKKSCDESRPKRLADDRSMLTARLGQAALYKRTGKAIHDACKVSDDQHAVVAPLERSGTSWTVTPAMLDRLKCSRPLPSGVTKNDAYVLLASEKANDKAFVSGPVLAPEEHATDDMRCATYDKAVGLDLFAAQYGDDASADKVLRWKAP